jgi:hypothetical protein
MQITLLEVHLDDASFSAAAPFSGSTVEDATSDDATDTDVSARADDDTGALGPGDRSPPKAAMALGLLVGVLGVAALVRYLRSDDDPDIDIETADESDRPVGVTVSDE